MIALSVTVIVFWGYCGLMSVAARGDHPLLQQSWFHAASVGLYLVLAGACTFAFLGVVNPGNVIALVLGLAMILILGVLLGSRYLAHLVSECVDRVRAAAIGVEHMKVEKTYDKAEKAMHEGKFDEAMAIYRAEAALDLQEPEPLRRMAEIHLRRGEVEAAVALLRSARALVQSEEDRTTLAFRTADILERAGRREEAREILESVSREFAGTRFEAYARERLKHLTPPASA